MAGRPLAVRRGMGRVQPRRRQSVGAIALPQSLSAALSAALQLPRSASAGLSTQVDLSSGGNTGNASFRYVNASAPAGGNGMTWATALRAVPNNAGRGLTYYIAGGSYSEMWINTAANGTLTITVKKATVADHGEDISGGWSSAMGDAQAVINGRLILAGPRIVIDGNTTNDRWSTTGYGIRVNNTGTNACLEFSAGASDCLVRKCEINSMGPDGSNVGNLPNVGVRWYGSCNRSVVSYCYLHDFGASVFLCAAPTSDVVVEHCRTGLFESTGTEHAETASIWGGAARFTFRHNLIMHCEGTGGLIFDGTGWFVYGNVFYREPGDNWQVGNGTVGSWSGSEVLQNCKVFNNVFINCQGNGGGPLVGAGIDLNNANVSQNECRNNIFMGGDRAVDFTWFPTHTHNTFVSVPGAAPSETGAYVTTTNPFVNYPALDFRLTDAAAAAMSAGTTLNAPYNVDPDGLVRGADGKWDRGVFEKA